MHRIVLVGQEHRHQETARVMGRSADKSVGDLRQASEENRAKLASTVNELRGRMGETASELKTMVSPAHIKQEIRNYVQQERESLTQAVRRKVRDNPLQAAAVGAAIAYPALGLLRSIPMPLWLIGAGLFLTSERGQQTTAAVKSNLDRTVQNGTEVLSEAAGALQSRLSDRVEQARADLSEVGKSAATAAESLTDQARAAFHDARDALEKSSTDVTAKLADVGHQLGDVGNETTESLKNSTSQAVARSQNALETLVHDYPLIIAGLGAVAGMFLAASVPASDAENRLFGAGSEKLKRRARDAASQGMERAGDFASDAIAATAAAAAREGFDSSGIRNVIDRAGEKVGAVVDRGLDTALGQPALSSSDQIQNAGNQS